MGKILRIDLTNKSVAEEKLKSEELRQFIGGSGLGAVMGSKKLKAIALKRGKLKPSLYNKGELLKDIKKVVP